MPEPRAAGHPPPRDVDDGGEGQWRQGKRRQWRAQDKIVEKCLRPVGNVREHEGNEPDRYSAAGCRNSALPDEALP